MATSAFSHMPLGEPDIRVEDYLDDKLQSTTDLESLDALLANVESQRDQLQAQLDDATRELEEARRAGETRQGSLKSQIDRFQDLQRSIDVRLEIVAASSAPDEAIHRLEKPMGQLHKIDMAHKYLLLLRDVEDLRGEARSHLPQSPKAALEPYTRLKQLSIYLKDLQRPADEAATHLVDHVANITEALWAEMKKTMWDELEALLAKRKWPNVDTQLEVDAEWHECFEKLVDLQVPEVLLSKQVMPLLPIDVMAQILVKEFRYHFLSERKTSQPSRIGEVCFPWFIDRVEKWEDFFRDNFSYALASRFNDTAASDKMVYMDPACALITSMLPVMREKVSSAMAEAVRSPSFLSSLMAQLMKFDEEIRSRFNYDGGDPERGWAGLGSEVLDKHFDGWLQAEKSFALERFQGIIESPDAKKIDYEYSGPGKTKPTYGAVRVTDLLRSVTGQYERVRRFSHKLRFLIDIQLAILDEFHDLLKSSLENYYDITSAVGRTLHGVTKEQRASMEGTGALEHLCKVYGSADHVVNTLKDWSNEEFFVTLWEQLHARAKSTEEQGDLAGGMSYQEVKDRTSSTVGLDEDGGVLFDETISAYIMRRKAAQAFLVEAVTDSHSKALRPYLQRARWTTIVEDSSAVDAQQLAITAELADPLATMGRNLDFLCKAVSTAVFRRILRESLEKLGDTLWNAILVGQSFTTYGAAQFMRDVYAVVGLVERYVPDGGGALDSLQDGVKLLNLPLELQEGDGGVMSLREASDRIFTDNDEARKVLQELEIETLTPANARTILQRRVENSE